MATNSIEVTLLSQSLFAWSSESILFHQQVVVVFVPLLFKNTCNFPLNSYTSYQHRSVARSGKLLHYKRQQQLAAQFGRITRCLAGKIWNLE